MSLQHVLLGMLEKGPRSGYELKKSLNTVLHYFWDADQSRIYRCLNDLCAKDWVQFETVIQESNPNKKIYTITEPGVDELRRWLSEPGKRMTERPRNPFLVQLHFSEAIPVEVQREVVRAHLAAMKSDLQILELEAAKGDIVVPLPEHVLAEGFKRSEFTLAYGIERYRFEVDWAERLLAILSAGDC